MTIWNESKVGVADFYDSISLIITLLWESIDQSLWTLNYEFAVHSGCEEV